MAPSRCWQWEKVGKQNLWPHSPHALKKPGRSLSVHQASLTPQIHWGFHKHPQKAPQCGGEARLARGSPCSWGAGCWAPHIPPSSPGCGEWGHCVQRPESQDGGSGAAGEEGRGGGRWARQRRSPEGQMPFSGTAPDTCSWAQGPASRALIEAGVPAWSRGAAAGPQVTAAEC